MGIKCIEDNSNVDKILSNLKSLKDKKLEIGILSSEDSELLKIANAHEFGAHITPKNGKYLSIPLSKKYKGVSPRSVEGLFVLKSKNGNLFLAKTKNRKGKKKNGDVELCYWLTKEVDIPERAFIRGGFDENKPDIESKGMQLISSLMNHDTDLDIVFETLGEYSASKLKSYLVDLKSPANSALTVKLKGSSNPLVDTGRLRDSISYRVKK